jgi:hypothetical protein
MRRALPALLILILLGGCGPLAVPAVRRLEAPEQEQIDRSWNNMLSPPARLDRELLLDTVEAFQLHHFGVDRLHMQSQKRFDGGTVTMDVYFDRGRREVDAFWITIRNPRGRLLRVERYPSHEVFAHAEDLGVSTSGERTRPTTRPSPNEQAAAQDAESERRFARIAAATQPMTYAPPRR